MEPVHEPGQIEWRVDKIKYFAGSEERVEPTATGVTTTRRTHSTLGESLIADSAVRSTITRDRLGLVTSVTEADGKITRLDYDARYRLASEKRVDAAGQLVLENCLMPNGATQLRSYVHTITARDARGRVLQEELPDGSVLAYTYDDADRIRSRKVNGTTVRSYTYTAPTALKKGVVRVTDELGGMTSMASIDGLGRTWSRTAARINDRVTYDTNGRVTTMSNVDNLVTQYRYNIHDDVTSLVDPRTGTSTYNRDGSGRLTSIVDADGATETFSYTYSGAPYQHYRGTWLVAERDYDPRGLVVNSVDDGVAKAMTYDTLGRLTKLREGVSGGGQLRVTNVVYDRADRVTEIARSPVAGLLTATTRIRYDGWGRPHEVVDPTGQHISREFDAADRIRRVTDQEGATLETRYDMFGRVTDHQVPGAGWRHTRYFGRQTYDGEPNLWRIESYDDETTTASEKIQRYTDGTGHTLAEVRPDGSSTKWIWSTGRVSRQEIRSGAELHRAADFLYGANGRLDSETRGPYVVNHQYTNAGRLWRTTTPDDTLERTYEHGLLATETQAGVRHRFLRGPTKTWVTGEQSQRGTGPVRFTEITRDDLGRVASMETNDGTHAEAVRTFSLYDAHDKPWFEQNTIGSINVVTGWVYDRKGRPRSRTTSGSGLPRKQTIWSWYGNDVLAPPSTFEVIAGSSLGLSAFLTSLAEGSEWILNIDGSSDSPYEKGPLCVVNCAKHGEQAPEGETVEFTPEKPGDAAEEIVVHAKEKHGFLKGLFGKKGDDDESGHKSKKLWGPSDLVADDFADIQRSGRAAKGSFAHTRIKRDVALPASVSSEPVLEPNPNRQASMVQRFAAEVRSEWDSSITKQIIFPSYENNPVVVGLEA